VFDPNGIKLEGLDGATPGRPHSFAVDTSGTGGLGDVVLDIALSGKSIQHQVEELGPNRYRVSFLPAQPGKYKVYVYFNGSEIRGEKTSDL
jgi:filamin